MNDIRKADLNLLIAFDALYDLRNVSRAADRLALTQPTVSGMLKRLRDLFEDPLFVRTQRGILPTPRADGLAQPIKNALAAIGTLIAPLRFDPATAELTVSISANDYMQHSVVVPLIGRLRKEAPNIRVAVLPAEIADLATKLAHGAIDLAITIPEFAGPDLRRSLLYTEHYVCVARKEHPHKRRKLSLKDFGRYEHVLVSPTGGEFAGPADRALGKLGEQRRVSVSLPSFYVLIETIRTGDLLAMVPARFLRGKMAGLKLFDSPMTIPSFDVIAAWHQRVDKDPAHRWLLSLLSDVAEGPVKAK